MPASSFRTLTPELAVDGARDAWGCDGLFIFISRLFRDYYAGYDIFLLTIRLASADYGPIAGATLFFGIFLLSMMRPDAILVAGQ